MKRKKCLKQKLHAFQGEIFGHLENFPKDNKKLTCLDFLLSRFSPNKNRIQIFRKVEEISYTLSS